MAQALKKYNSKKAIHAATSVGMGALCGYRAFLRTKLIATDVAIKGLQNINRKQSYQAVEKENDKMKSFLSALTVLTVAGAALGAAGYYLYKKEKELSDYEDLLFNEEYAGQYPQDEHAAVCDAKDCRCSEEAQPSEEAPKAEQPGEETKPE